jgi:hypothetical protein
MQVAIAENNEAIHKYTLIGKYSVILARNTFYLDIFTPCASAEFLRVTILVLIPAQLKITRNRY